MTLALIFACTGEGWDRSNRMRADELSTDCFRNDDVTQEQTEIPRKSPDLAFFLVASLLGGFFVGTRTVDWLRSRFVASFCHVSKVPLSYDVAVFSLTNVACPQCFECCSMPVAAADGWRLNSTPIEHGQIFGPGRRVPKSYCSYSSC